MATDEIITADGHRIRVLSWIPDSGQPDAVLHLLHGLGEHAGRYERFAKICNDRNIAVVAQNHRGHGDTAKVRGHFADRDGWTLLISDALAVQDRIRRQFTNLPIVLIGHSMGSFIAQSFALRHPHNLAMLVLSASTFARRSELRVSNGLARFLSLFGKQTKPGMLNDMGFGAFNKSFQPARTGMDWLSRDEAEVDKYIADPLCGGRFSTQLWVDLTGGLLEITSTRAVAAIPRELPVLIFGGERDPVGGTRGLGNLASVYRETGHRDVTLKVYDGGRHEMLNETNRDAVTADIIAWIEARLT